MPEHKAPDHKAADHKTPVHKAADHRRAEHKPRLPEASGAEASSTPDEDAAQPTPGAGARLLHALTRPSRSQVVVGLLLAALGFSVVTQVRANTVDDTYAGLREQDLIDVLNGLADTTQRANAEIQRLEETRDDLLSETNARTAALEQATTELDVLSVLAGTVAVTGPGVQITIKEVAGPVRLEPFIDMVQALRSAGAEAIQINSAVRVVASTSFRDTEGGVIVGGTLLRAPYVIDVIGSPPALVAALRFPNGPQDQFQKDNIAELTYTELNAVDITTVAETSQPGFAQSGAEQ